MVGLTELESVTSSMSTRHSNHLSYNPIVFQVALKTSAIIAADFKTVKENFRFAFAHCLLKFFLV